MFAVFKPGTKLMAIMLLFSIFAMPVAWAESLSPDTYETLIEIQELLAASDIDTAKAKLAELDAEVEDDSLSKAIVMQTWGYAEMSSDNYAGAVEKFQASLAINKLPESVEMNVRYMLAQLFASQGQFKQALSEAQQWYAKLEKPKPDQTMFLANIFAQLSMYDDAIEYATTAIEKSNKPKERWYQLVLACYFETKQFDQSASVLKTLINKWPDKSEYWEQLASVYLLTEQNEPALSTLQLAWKQGLLDKEATIKSMVQLAINQNIPDRAARLITQAIDANLLPKDEVYLGMIAKSWLQAREKQKAADAYADLDTVVNDGSALLQQAKLLMELEQWTTAQGTLQSALDKGLEDTSRAWLMLGITQIELELFSDGKRSLRKAQAFKSVKSQARAWINYAEQKLSHNQWKARNVASAN